MMTNIKERFIGATGSVSGAASIFGSWQVCHNACLGLIAVLGLIGITLTGMPLAFLTKVAIPFWSIAVILLLVTVWLYKKKKCISKNLLVFNSGLIIAGVPFQSTQSFSPFFWFIGGALAIAGVAHFIKEKIDKKRYH